MEIYRRFHAHGWFLGGLVVLGWIVAINLFPADHIIVGGDVLQPINLKEQYANLHAGWFSGRGSLFYGLFYLLEILGISATGQLSWYLGIFLFGAYLSFWVFARLTFPQAPRFLAAALALFYAANVYTLYIFTATWGFTSYQILYVFIPALTGLYMAALVTRRLRFGLLFLLVTAFASMSFSNPAFAVSLSIYFLLLTFALFLFRRIRLERDVLRRIALLALGALLLNAYWILPLVPQARSGVAELSASTDIVLTESLAKTSNAIYDTLRLLPTHEQKIYYPYNFPYPDIPWMKYGVIALTFLPFFLVLIGAMRKRSKQEKTLFFIFFTLLVVFVPLVARVRFPFDAFNAVFFQLPGLNALRGWDKLAIYTPFLLSVLLLEFFATGYGKRCFRVIFAGFCAGALFLALPFYAGGIQTKLSYILVNNRKKDFQDAKYSALVRIPQSYYAVADIFSADPDESKISMLPYSPGSSVGRVNLPKWKVNGPHPAHMLYTKKFVELNDYYFGKWSFAEEFDKKEYDPRWITDLYGLLGIEYVFYHKDARSASLEAFEPARAYLETQGLLQPLTENTSFILYRLDQSSLFPYVYASLAPVRIEPTVQNLSDRIRAFRAHVNAVPYTRMNLNEISLPAGDVTEGSTVFLNERHDPLWRAEHVAPDGSRFPLARNDEVRYANAWKAEKIGTGGVIEIYYLPTRLLSAGLAISGGTFALVLLLLVRERRKKI